MVVSRRTLPAAGAAKTVPRLAASPYPAGSRGSPRRVGLPPARLAHSATRHPSRRARRTRMRRHRARAGSGARGCECDDLSDRGRSERSVRGLEDCSCHTRDIAVVCLREHHSTQASGQIRPGGSAEREAGPAATLAAPKLVVTVDADQSQRFRPATRRTSRPKNARWPRLWSGQAALQPLPGRASWRVVCPTESALGMPRLRV